MSDNLNLLTETAPMFQLKGGLYTLTSLQLLGTQLDLFNKQLQVKIQQAPKFFYHAPVVIDLQKINRPGTEFDFKRLKDILLSQHLIPVGIKGANTEQQSKATAAGLSILQEGTNKERQPPADSMTPTTPPEPIKEPKTEESEIRGSNTRVISEPVRSGQQIYVRGGDLIVLAPVSHGAELLADGHIHVYGPLRGRALAGVTGDITAQIFCQNLEAELISIAGNYKISEDIDQGVWNTAVGISLKDGHLHFSSL